MLQTLRARHIQLCCFQHRRIRKLFDERLQVTRRPPPLLHTELDGLHRVRGPEVVALVLIGLDERPAACATLPSDTTECERFFISADLKNPGNQRRVHYHMWRNGVIADCVDPSVSRAQRDEALEHAWACVGNKRKDY